MVQEDNDEDGIEDLLEEVWDGRDESGLTPAERRRMERARRERERADMLRQANVGTSRDGSAGPATSGRDASDGQDSADSTNELPAHTFLAMLRQRFGKSMDGFKHRGRFTGEPIAIAGDAIKYKHLRHKLETYCKVHKTSVSIDRLAAVRQCTRKPDDLAQ